MIRTFCNFSQWVFYNKQFAQMSILSNLTKSPFCPGIPGVPGVPAWPWNYNNRKLLYYIAISLRHFKINLPLPRRYFDLVEFFLVSFLCTERWFPRSTLLAVGSLFAFLFCFIWEITKRKLFATTYMELIQTFKTTAIMDAKWWKLYACFFFSY